jgi:O-antigen/teichoic acid export membrane protein
MGVGLFIPNLYGEEFADAVIPFQLLCIGVLLIATTKTLKSYIYIYMEKPQISTFASVGNFAINVLLLLILVKPYGLTGAAIATVAGYLFYAGVHVYTYAKHSGNSVYKTLVLQKEDLKIYTKLFQKLRTRLKLS